VYVGLPLTGFYRLIDWCDTFTWCMLKCKILFANSAWLVAGVNDAQMYKIQCIMESNAQITDSISFLSCPL